MNEIQSSGIIPLETRNEKGQFLPGIKPEGAGRPLGCKNKFTTLKNAFVEVFQEVQGNEVVNLKAFAVKHPKDFYTIVSRLFPSEVQVSGPDGGPVNIDIRKLLVDKLNDINKPSVSNEPDKLTP